MCRRASPTSKVLATIFSDGLARALKIKLVLIPKR
jgi:hypothetical protein